MSDDLRGADEMIAALKDIEEKTAVKFMRRAQRAAAKVIATHLRAKAPIGSNLDEDIHAGQLKNSITVKAMKRSRKGPGMVVGWFRSMFPKAFYAGFIEYGWMAGRRKGKGGKPVAGTHFAEHAFESAAEPAMAALTESLKEDFAKEAASAKTIK